MNLTRLKIVTPTGIFFDEDIISVETTTTEGRIGILANHINLIAMIKNNILTLKNKNNVEESFVLTSGYLFVTKDSIKILTNFCELKKNINIKDIENEVSKSNSLLNTYQKDSVDYRILQQKIKKQSDIIESFRK